MADRRLQVFHTVARLLSFTKAAETLHMTQPAVTFQIRQLEEHFNTRLFDRTHNRISLTVAGQRVFEYAEHIKLYQGHEFLLEYPLPPYGIKNEKFAPPGEPKPRGEPEPCNDNYFSPVTTIRKCHAFEGV